MTAVSRLESTMRTERQNMLIRWHTTKATKAAITRIVDRAIEMSRRAGVSRDEHSLEMDITACHLNGMPLKLDALEKADDFNFAHDVFGIERHIDRETAQLRNFFVPRFAK